MRQGLWASVGLSYGAGRFFLDKRVEPSSLTVQVNPRFLAQANVNKWLSALSEGRSVFFPEVIKEQVHWSRLDAEALKPEDEAPEWGLERIRASEPVKSFFFSPRERVATFPEKMEPGETEKRVLLGAKGCDVVALRVHRQMFLEGDFKDEFYERRRANTAIIVADCPSPGENCFCNLVGHKPFVDEEYKDEADVSLSVVKDGWLLEPLTPLGEELIGLADTSDPAAGHLDGRIEARERARARLKDINPKGWNPDPPPPGQPDPLAERIAKRQTDEEFWAKHGADCVECYGCLMGCPTCYCFLLYDKAKEEGMERTKVWDACYIAAYARVGGGANPRSEFVKRFYNRFYCKFSHYRTWQGMYACTGCGRCIAACMGKIDIRKVLLEV